MPSLSIRQVADKLKVSHTSVRNAIADIQAESGLEIGKSQGPGKPTLLSEAEQELIAERFYKPADVDPPTDRSSVFNPSLTYGIPGLSTEKRQSWEFMTEDIDLAKESYQESGQMAVIEAATLVQTYASFRAVQTMKEIDATFEGIKASAINQAVSTLGKPTDPHAS